MRRPTCNPCDECPYGIDRRDGSGSERMCKICEFPETQAKNARLRAELEQATAQAAAMREAAINVLSVKYCQITYEDQRNIMALEQALSSDAGAALLEEVRRLREIEALLIENKDLANQYNESDAVRKIDALLRKEGDYETE